MNKSCEDKASFQSAEEARAAALQADFEYERDQKLVPYECDKCSLYHLKTDYDDV